jgi:hypothetical protein
MLFPASAVFWWFFEYLNRFVQNWYYLGVAFGAFEYFLFATLPFCTVLPAVLSVQHWLAGQTWIERAFGSWKPMRVSHPKAVAAAVLVMAAAGMIGIGLYPNALFPLLWIAPLLIIVSLQVLYGEPHVFSRLATGDWRLVVSSALAALVCGFFWEMWNYCSLAKWEYSVPFVHRFLIFEMPVIGYAGYLPFGLECSAIGLALESLSRSRIPANPR